jgi:tetratricopeptide (TPR) repeat protein
LRKLLIVPVVVTLVALAAAALPPPNLDRALAAQRALVERQPTAERWNDLGNLLQLAGDDAVAREAYEKALALDSTLASSHYNLGLLLRQAGEANRAQDHFREVVELEPTNAWGWFQVGALHEARGSTSAAVRAYARAFAIDPRLSFTDVNPQVIDSKLTTQALLQARRELPAASEAARAYEDPRHIAKLLLPQQPPAGSAPTPAAGEPPVAGTGVAPGMNEPRVLRPEDLPAGSRVGTATGIGPDATGRPGTESPGYSELLRQQLELQQMEEQQRMDEEGEQPGVYVPGVRSSAQLDQRLEELPG